jgi:hypothetical protein
MNERLQNAMNNIKLITGQARLTREEHKQIIDDIDIIFRQAGLLQAIIDSGFFWIDTSLDFLIINTINYDIVNLLIV